MRLFTCSIFCLQFIFMARLEQDYQISSQRIKRARKPNLLPSALLALKISQETWKTLEWIKKWNKTQSREAEIKFAVPSFWWEEYWKFMTLFELQLNDALLNLHCHKNSYSVLKYIKAEFHEISKKNLRMVFEDSSQVQVRFFQENIEIWWKKQLSWFIWVMLHFPDDSCHCSINNHLKIQLRF